MTGSDKNEVRNQLEAGAYSQAEVDKILKVVREKYKNVSVSAEGNFKYITGKSGAMFLGYASSDYKDIPSDCMNGFCGVGNPFSIHELHRGDSVLDIGCGAGFDLIVARRKVGGGGQVCGIDLTKEMVERAEENFKILGVEGIEIHAVDSVKIPFPDDHFNRVISNGVINLSPCKPDLFKEIFRVLKPGGRLQFADIVLDKDLPELLVGSLEAWSQ